MGGGLMQLVAYGAQDIYLTGNPQITFFKVVYRRHTNFAVESIEQTFNGSASAGNKFSCTISRNGDLLHRVYLEVDHDDTSSGFGMIDHVEVEIGGQCIDKHYGEWLHIWNQLTNQEKNKLKTLEELKKNLSIFLKAISLARQDFLNSNNILKFGRKNENLNKKKWVRNDENDNIVNSNKNNLLTLEMPKKATNQSIKDTIKEVKNN